MFNGPISAPTVPTTASDESPGERGPSRVAAMAGAEAEHPLPTPPRYPTSTKLIAQGAEGRLFQATYLFPDLPCALKYRPPKAYRHPLLDRRLTRHRILAEAKVLVKCRREGVPVPAVYALDEEGGCLLMEWISGEPVRTRLNRWLAARLEVEVGHDPELKGLMRRVGVAVGRLHQVGVIHGDLTTSNMMLRPRKEDPTNGRTSAAEGTLDGDIVIIDFGLASQAISEEDRAVDLYVLERAFGSTHPRAESLFEEVLDGYREVFKQSGVVIKRLDDVRLRGRKRSMLG